MREGAQCQRGLPGGEGEERSLPMREGAQCQKWGVLNINEGVRGRSMPTRAAVLNAKEGGGEPYEYDSFTTSNNDIL